MLKATLLALAVFSLSACAASTNHSFGTAASTLGGGMTTQPPVSTDTHPER
jgi:hypothetical protein